MAELHGGGGGGGSRQGLRVGVGVIEFRREMRSKIGTLVLG